MLIKFDYPVVWFCAICDLRKPGCRGSQSFDVDQGQNYIEHSKSVNADQMQAAGWLTAGYDRHWCPECAGKVKLLEAEAKNAEAS